MGNSARDIVPIDLRENDLINDLVLELKAMRSSDSEIEIKNKAKELFTFINNNSEKLKLKLNINHFKTVLHAIVTQKMKTKQIKESIQTLLSMILNN